MLCEICNKNQASIHIQEIVKGQKHSLHICSSCAEKKGLSEMALQGINIAEILYKISTNVSSGQDIPDLDFADASPDEKEEVFSGASCEACGWNTDKFNKTGRLGCAKCYAAFKDILKEALKNMHKGTMHVGKRPRGPGAPGSDAPMLEIMSLQRLLDEHVQREEYEQAAKVRDRLKALREQAGEAKP